MLQWQPPTLLHVQQSCLWCTTWWVSTSKCVFVDMSSGSGHKGKVHSTLACL
jgi:hypothetical protein